MTENFLIGESVFIVGHKNPDLDAVVSAFAYQVYRHAKGDFNYVAIRCDEVKPQVTWVFNHQKIDLPMLMKNIAGRRIVLVDHTDPEQRPDGWEDAEIIEVLDHHKLKLETSIPPKITIRPYGSTSTLIAYKMLTSKIVISKELAGLLLAAILDDTMAFRSPITTHVDRSVAGELSNIAVIPDLGAFAKKIFDKKDNWSRLSPQKIISSDIKDFDLDGVICRIAQVETMNNRKLEERESELLTSMRSAIKKDSLNLYILMLTDLLTNDCIMLVEGTHAEHAEKIFQTEMEGRHKLYLPGVLSRKKQVVPPLVEYFKRLAA